MKSEEENKHTKNVKGIERKQLMSPVGSGNFLVVYLLLSLLVILFVTVFQMRKTNI